MVQTRSATPLAVLAASLLTLAVACDSGGGARPQAVVEAGVTLTGIQVGPAVDGAVAATVGTPVQLAAVGTYSDGSMADLTAAVAWTSSNPDAATVAAGLVTPAAAGSAEITATDPGTGLSAGVTVSVSAAPVEVTLTGIEVGPAVDGAVSAALGVPVQLAAVGTYSDGSTADLTASVVWTSSSVEAATVDAGLVTPVAVGTAEITATDPGSGLFAGVTVSVSAAPVEITLTGIQVGPAVDGTVSALIGTPVLLSAVGTYSDGSTADLTASVAWTSSDLQTATVDAGLVTPLAAGIAEITATDPESGLYATVSVSISPDPSQIVAVAIDPLDPSILIGTSLQLEGWGIFADDTTIELANLVWTSSNEAVATVSAGGLVTALALGRTTVTVTDPLTGLGAATTVEVTDVPGALSYLKVTPRSVIGGGPVAVTGTVALTSAVDGPVVIALQATKDAATVPAFVVVPAGVSRVTFDVPTAVVMHNTLLFVLADDGTLTKKATLNVRTGK